jgi:hypothetical protein
MAYRLAGALKMPGQGWSESESREALDICNAMIDGWRIERLLIIFYIRTIVNLVLNQKDYSVGPGQDWNIERQEKIHAAGFVLNLGTPTESELPMSIVLSYEEYANIVAKNVQGSIPLILYYRATLPYGTATIWPVYNQQISENNGPTCIALYTRGVLQEFATIDDPIIMPQGFREMLLYNLAWRIHQRPPYNKMPIDPDVKNMAIFYKQRVKNQQLTPLIMTPDRAVNQNGQRDNLGSFPKAWSPYW